MVTGPLTALLGPTNTGKTHRAIERMLEHESGMIGLPLRLLAREVYDRVSTRVGERAVALVTGEEKRVPPRPRYWVCTVEAMPIEKEVDFVAVDEIQLAAHPERGHVFTDRVLRARGARETWFMGSDTMRPLLKALLPTAEVWSHPRLSKLSAAGSRSLGSLPPRSAVVGFSMARIYEIAERVRRRRGGAAVVLGALSPRTRNAQVALFQAREVDYMVATDAIGMGLNLDLEHVAFADLVKFDGREARALDTAELAQIAGRAGRYHTDGTFGTLAPLPALPVPVARAIETHRFAATRSVFWRNADLDFSSLEALIGSLKQPAQLAFLRPAEGAEDFAALVELARRDEICKRARGRVAVELLWDVCRIPDYRQLLLDQHAALLAEIYLQLSGPRGLLDADWMAGRVGRLHDVGGDIDTLLMRLAFIRTWTYVAHQTRWVEDATTWQERARAIEDALSDALHERLVERFVERRRTTAHVRTAAELNSPFVRLQELRAALFEPETVQPDGRWVDHLLEAAHDELDLDEQGQIRFDDRVVGSLARGVDLVHPEVVLSVDAELGPGDRSRLQRRLVAFTRDVIAEIVGSLQGEAMKALSPAGRGLVYQLAQGLGTTKVNEARAQIVTLSDEDHAALDAADVRIGERLVYVVRGLSPSVVRRRFALARAWFGADAGLELPAPGSVSFRPKSRAKPAAYTAIGYPLVGPRAIRADVVERLSDELAQASREGRPPTRLLSSWIGCPRVELPEIGRALGHEPTPEKRRRSRRRSRPRPVGRATGS